MSSRALQVGALSLLLIGCSEDPSGDGEAETAGTEAETGDGDSNDNSGDGDGDSNDNSGDGDGDSTGDGDPDPGPQGVFVGVGDGGRRASSTDGVDWAEIVGSGVIDTQAETGQEDILRAVAVGDGVIVAVGGGGSDWNGNAMIMRSTDGVTWQEDLIGGTNIANRKLSAIGFVDGVFIAGGHQAHILRSDDGGLGWTRVYGENHSSTTVYGVAGHGDLFVLVGIHQDAWDQPKVSYVHRSTDRGLSFEAPQWFGVDGDQLTSIASNGELFVAVGPQLCLRSVDGVVWEPCGLSSSSFGAVSFSRGRFIVTYQDGLSTSSNGESWSAHVTSPTGVPTEVVFGNGVYAGVRYYDRGISEALGEWSYVTHGGFPLRDLAFLPLE
jgi:hypothetical protein